MSADTVPTVTQWWWVRHAPVVGVAGQIYGQRDVPCDTSDAPAFRALAQFLPENAVWVTSHLGRARETARAIQAQGLRASPPLVETDLAEQSFGDWEGLTWDEFHAAHEAAHAAFWEDPGHSTPPGGESVATLNARTAKVIERLTREHMGSAIVAVAHGGSVRGALAAALGLGPAQALNLKIDHLTVTRIDHISPPGPRGVPVILNPGGLPRDPPGPRGVPVILNPGGLPRGPPDHEERGAWRVNYVNRVVI